MIASYLGPGAIPRYERLGAIRLYRGDAIAKGCRVGRIELRFPQPASLTEVAVSDIVAASPTPHRAGGRLRDQLRIWSASDAAIRVSVNGLDAPPVLDAESMRMLADLIDRLEMIQAIRVGSDELDRGLGLTVEQAKAEVLRTHGLSL